MHCSLNYNKVGRVVQWVECWSWPANFPCPMLG